jgi:hypothetical protein
MNFELTHANLASAVLSGYPAYEIVTLRPAGMQPFGKRVVLRQFKICNQWADTRRSLARTGAAATCPREEMRCMTTSLSSRPSLRFSFAAASQWSKRKSSLGLDQAGALVQASTPLLQDCCLNPDLR